MANWAKNKKMTLAVMYGKNLIRNNCEYSAYLASPRNDAIRYKTNPAASIFGLVMIVMNSESINKFGDLTIPVSGADWSKGPAEAGIILVEYSDFQCPACGSYYSLLKLLNEEYFGKIKFVYRHFPLSQIHKNDPPRAIKAIVHIEYLLINRFRRKLREASDRTSLRFSQRSFLVKI